MEARRTICQEPTLDEMLTDPIVRLMMSRDAVTRIELEALIGKVRNIRSKETDNASVREERL